MNIKFIDPGPRIGPWIHAAIVWLLVDGTEITQYVWTYATTHDDATWSWSRFGIGLLAAAGAAAYSSGRNRGAVTLPKGIEPESLKDLTIETPDPAVKGVPSNGQPPR